MTIIRAPRPESNFYILDKRISEDKRLSFAARGALIYLLGKPDKWKLSIQAMVNETVNSRKQSGREAVYAILKELADIGYIRRVQNRDASGRVLALEYHVSEIPDAGNPHADSQDAADPDKGKPLSGKPDAVNTRLVSTEYKQELSKARIDIEQGLNKEAKNLPAASRPVAQAEFFLEPPSPKEKKSPAKLACTDEPKSESKTAAVWHAYAGAYQKRYGVEPVRNAKVNGQLGQLISRLGAEEAPAVAQFYVGHSDKFYVSRVHPADMLLRDAEKLRTEWKTGRQAENHYAKNSRRGVTYGKDSFDDIDYSEGIGPNGQIL
jgi:hypothetical protein